MEGTLRMRSVITLMMCVILFFGCSENKVNVVNDFNTAYTAGDNERLASLLADSFRLVDHNNSIVLTGKNAYLNEVIAWNNVFNTEWKVIGVEDRGDSVVVLEENSDAFFDFLYGQPIRYKYSFKVDDGLISQIRYDSVPGHSLIEKRGSEQYQLFFAWMATARPEDLTLFYGDAEITGEKMKELIEAYTTRDQEI